MADDFPVTRRTIERLDAWLNALASPLLPLQRIPAGPPELGGFQWIFQEQTERALLVGKTVRMISGIRAALVLADIGYIAECGTILRTVADFVNEVISICEGCIHGATTAQKRFVQQYFAPFPLTPEEYAKQGRDNWVTRDELLAAEQRNAQRMGWDADRLRKNLRFLSYGYDKFVHGAYITSMELFDARTNTFMTRGHEWDAKRREYKAAIASKLHEVLAAMVTTANVMNMPALVLEIRQAAQEMTDSGEMQGGFTSN
jgi:hypothetical protein